MALPQKVCSIPYRRTGRGLEVLAFHHPLAGKQFVKGSIEAGEPPVNAAARELLEEAGITLAKAPAYFGEMLIGSPPLRWHFFAFESEGLPETWDHRTEDDGGHLFSFFWHPIVTELDGGWHPIFHLAFRWIRTELPSLLG